MNAAPYARYSTDNQSASSIDDQLRVCRDLIAREGWTESAAYFDREISGSITDRAGYQELLTACRAGKVAVIVVEEVSRLWRAQAEQWRCVEELEFLGIHIIGVRDGIDTRRSGFEYLLAMRGAMNAGARRETAWRVHRGLTGKIERGLCAGGVPFGYTTIDADNGRALQIVDAQAAIVRDIFQRFAAGESCKSIALELNARGIPSPRGASWAQNAIYGHPGKGTGILNQELYIGRLIWNRTRWVQKPGSKQRKRIERPRSEWLIQTLPDLRIVPDELWQAVKAAQAQRGKAHPKGGRPAHTLFGGILRCGHCGGPVVKVDAYRYGCSRAKNCGPTACQGLTVDLLRTDRLLLDHLRDDLLAPATIRRLQTRVRDKLKTRQTPPDTQAARKRLTAIDRELANLTDAIARMGWSETLQQRIQTLETERHQIQKTLTERTPAPEKIVQMIPRLLDKYRALAEDPAPALKANPQRARQALRAVMGEIELQPAQGGTWARLSGLYAGVLAVADNGGSGGLIFGLSANSIWIPSK